TGAHNVIPDTAEMIGTCRTYSHELRARLKDRIRQVARHVAQGFGADIEYEYKEVIDMTINDPAATDFCARVARGIVGDENVDANVDPSLGGEDFGAMMLDRPGCYIRLGQA